MMRLAPRVRDALGQIKRGGSVRLTGLATGLAKTVRLDLPATAAARQPQLSNAVDGNADSVRRQAAQGPLPQSGI